MKSALGTKLRHLIELLDGAVTAAYADAGLDFRPRFTAVVRALIVKSPLTIGELATIAGITQPAATQTIALMIKQGLLVATPGAIDARQKLIRLTDRGQAMLPDLQACWDATGRATHQLEAELPFALDAAIDSAIAALTAKPFDARIRAARAAQKPHSHNKEP